MAVRQWATDRGLRLTAAALLSLAALAPLTAAPAPAGFAGERTSSAPPTVPGADAAMSEPTDRGAVDHFDLMDEHDLSLALPRPRPEPPAKPAAPHPQHSDGNASLDALCPIIEGEAKLNGLPPAFFARLIWQESRFNPKAVSPKGAQGIAQFMPGTAAERGLLDPFDPAEAIPHSALYLRELRNTFGNIGLAAAAYNAGPNRVTAWLSGAGTLPLETKDFVLSITGRTAQVWTTQDGEAFDITPEEARNFQAACRRLGTLIAKRPSPTHNAIWQPWGVQVAADFSQPRALAIYSRVRARFGSMLPGSEPMVVHTKNLSRGAKPLHAVRIGAPSRPGAQKICDRLRSAGGVCVVVKN